MTERPAVALWLTYSVDIKDDLLSPLLSVGRNKTSYEVRSGECGGWGMVGIWFLI